MDYKLTYKKYIITKFLNKKGIVDIPSPDKWFLKLQDLINELLSDENLKPYHPKEIGGQRRLRNDIICYGTNPEHIILEYYIPEKRYTINSNYFNNILKRIADCLGSTASLEHLASSNTIRKIMYDILNKRYKRSDVYNNDVKNCVIMLKEYDKSVYDSYAFRLISNEVVEDSELKYVM